MSLDLESLVSTGADTTTQHPGLRRELSRLLILLRTHRTTLAGESAPVILRDAADHRLVTSRKHPDLIPEMFCLGSSPWPEFADHDPVVNAHWPAIYELASDCRFAVVDERARSLPAMAKLHPGPIGRRHGPRYQNVASMPRLKMALHPYLRMLAGSALITALRPERLGQTLSGPVSRRWPR